MRVIKKDGMTVKVIENPHAARNFIRNSHKWPEDRALDFETTGLDPRYAQARLTCISLREDEAYIIDHFKCGSFASFSDDLAGLGPWYVFNANFEGAFFDHEAREAEPVRLYDVGHMRRSVRGGGPLNLATQIKWDLGISISKDLQNSDWSQHELSSQQLFYGGCDAIHTRALGRLWKSEMSDDHWRGFRIINDTWRAVNECQQTGLLIDEGYHRSLINMWDKRRAAAEAGIRRWVPEEQLENIRSKKQISDLLKRLLDDDAVDAWPKTAKTHQLQTSRDILRQASFNAPYPLSRFLAALMVFNRSDKYLSTYGETLITKQQLSEDGRIHGRLNMAQAITGRFSSSNPNMQNIPNSPVVRKSFIAGRDNKLILADYSGIEVRVLAELSGDKILLHDCIYDDVHSRSAIAIYNLDADEFLERIKNGDPKAKAMRTRAKGFTFQLLYGAGAAALSLVLRCSIGEAEEAIMAWANRYQKAYSYRNYAYEVMCHSGFIHCKSGRTIYVNKRDRSIPVAANYGVQGSAGDVLYGAMQAMHRIERERDLPCDMMVTVHDELLLLCYSPITEDQEDCKEALEDAMVEGWLRVFPDTSTENLVEATIADNWGGKK